MVTWYTNVVVVFWLPTRGGSAQLSSDLKDEIVVDDWDGVDWG